MQEQAVESELARRFRAQAESALPRAPLVSALSRGIAAEPALFELLYAAPTTQRVPVLLLAALQYLVIEDPSQPLAAWYPSVTDEPRSPDDPELMAAVRSLAAARRAELEELLRTRSVQTNEVGRCAVLVPALGMVAAEMGPIAHLDIGASAGLTLLTDRYEYRYELDGTTRTIGGPSAVVLSTGCRGAVPVPVELPGIAARCGVDPRPVDVTDAAEARWLVACVWPEQRDRMQRLHAAIDIALEQPPELLAGDAVSSVAPAVERMRHAGHPVVTNTWVLNYLTAEQRRAYADELDRTGAEVDLSWIFLEAPALTPELPGPTQTVDPYRSELTLVRWRRGHRVVDHLATCHPHGYWIHWRG